MARIEVGFSNAAPWEISDGVYTIELSIGGGNFAYHVGPAPFPYFTLEQAEATAAKINDCGTIDPAYWTDAYLRPLTAAMVAPRPKLAFA
jgi:hypothetical protein